MNTPILALHIELGNSYQDTELVEIPISKDKLKEINKLTKQFQQDKINYQKYLKQK